MIHLMSDGYGGSENRLNDLRTVNALLNDLVCKLQIDSEMPPFLLPYNYAKDSDDDGISAFVILRGGHITLHTFPHRGCVFADLLYDGNVCEEIFADCLNAYFKLGEQKTHSIRRGDRKDTSDNCKISAQSHTGDFGPHIIAEINNAETDMERIFDMLDELPKKINMQPISRPYVIKSRKIGGGFISGLVLIAQSHIAFHYSIAEKKLFCDAFSCSFYRSEQFYEYLGAKFKDLEYTTLIRGSKHDSKIKGRADKIKQLSRWNCN